MPANDVRVSVNGLWKRYGLPVVPMARRSLDRMRGIERGPDAYGPWALSDVSLEVKAGETFGLIGRNGAGKSTLLKILAGVSPPTRGDVTLRGSMFPMIELNAGTNQELTGRENIHLLGTIMGLSRAEVARRYDEIADFTELGEWLEKPVWQYSSGMKARLGFGVAVNIDAEVLLVDEVLAVGDLAFRKKCFGYLERLSYEGAAILFVSHNIKQVERICDRVAYLKKGRIVEMGNPEHVCYVYNEDTMSGALDHLRENLSDYAKWTSAGDVDILDIKILNGRGEPADMFELGDKLTVHVEYDAHERLECPRIGINVLTSELVKVTNFRTDRYDTHFVMEGRGVLQCTIPAIPFMPDCYTVGFNISTENGRRVFRGDSLLTFCVDYTEATHTTYGLVQVDAEWTLP